MYYNDAIACDVIDKWFHCKNMRVIVNVTECLNTLFLILNDNNNM